MTNYLKFPTWADSGHVHAVVETPRGSRAKLEFDPKLGAFTLAKPLLWGADLSLRLGLHTVYHAGARRTSRRWGLVFPHRRTS
jgi:inorganic pyrophosphatase